MIEHYNATETKAYLSRLIAKIKQTGEEIILTRAGKPVTSLKPQQAPNFGWHENK